MDRPCGLCQTLGPTEGSRSATTDDVQLDYGTLPHLETRQECPICRLILKMVPSNGLRIPNTMVTAAQGHVSTAGSLNGAGIRVFYDSTYQGLITSVPPVNTTSKTSSLMFHLIKDWIKECENHHQDDVSTLAPRYEHPIDIILIDVPDQRLVRASSSWRFLATSYVWGKAALETTTTANRRAREQRGALSKVILPQLILDAMSLVSQLGERYLWVDFLCIEQDNFAQKHSQISQMDVIYSQSLLTLVALSSEDAGSFLPGIQEGTRSFFKAKEYVFGRYIYAIYPRLLEFSEATVYESRGWTFQERLLSRRCLFLTECDMYYICHSRLSCETGAKSAEREEEIFENKFRNIFSQLAQLDRFSQIGPHWTRWTATFRLYASLVHEYSKRELSYDTDVINAFSGISAVLGHFLHSSSLSGLIECVLDNCLLWVPGNSNTHCRNLNFPSWSWAGWRGEVFYLNGPLYAYSAAYRSQLILKSLVDKFETQSMSPLRPILRVLQHQENSAIASGEPEKATKGIELLSFEATTADIAQINLSSRESVVRGDICGPSNETHSRSVRIFKIMDANQQTCGYLHSFPGTLISPASAQNHRELVALSLSELGETRNPLALIRGRSMESDNYSILFDHTTFKRKSWCLLNIMLVEWKGSEAERVTIGQIHIDAWNTLSAQRKCIRLI
ncbi:heterokaryon incompatibility protein-domain-containing protein [Hyaloscypha finlandica]|nr:heterokaryon incompatibility protein-domain-containing protein [Hyaloscypha finlandica]